MMMMVNYYYNKNIYCFFLNIFLFLIFLCRLSTHPTCGRHFVQKFNPYLIPPEQSAIKPIQFFSNTTYFFLFIIVVYNSIPRFDISFSTIFNLSFNF